MLPWQQLLPGIDEKLIRSNLCRVMEGKEPIKLFISPRNRRKVLPWQYLLPGIVEKLVSSNPCRGLECKEPTKRFIYRSKKNKLPWGLECKEPTKRFLNPRNMKSVAKYPQNHNLKNNTEKVLPWQQLLPKKHHHYFCSSPCKKYILKILVKIFA